MYGLAHIGINVRDCQKSADFYCRVLGCEQTDEFQNDHIKLVYLQLGDQVLELVQYLKVNDEQRPPGTIDHIGITVNDIDREVLRLKELAVTCLFDSPRQGVNGQKIMFFLGPDGERLEFLSKE